MLNEIEHIIRHGKGKKLDEFREEFKNSAGEIFSDVIDEMFLDLHDFTFIDPKIPADNKKFTSTSIPVFSAEDSREEIIEIISGLAEKSETALLTLHVFRQMDMISWLPFIKAAIERNPVCFTDLNGKSVMEVFKILGALPDESIYDGRRLALPDEVWNFKRGDGIEKALLLADFIMQKDTSSPVLIEIAEQNVKLKYKDEDFLFTSSKLFTKSILISGSDYSIRDLS
jgi:hypothetical protein